MRKTFENAKHRCRGWFVVALWLAIVTMAAPAHAGKLKQLRKETRSSSNSSSNSTSSNNSRSFDDSDDDEVYDDGDDIDSIIFMYVFTSPWWLPYSATNDRYGRNWAFADYPYADGRVGYSQFQGVGQAKRLPDGREYLGQSSALRLRAEAGTLTSGGALDQNLSRLTLAARFSTNFRLELDTEWTLWSENLAEGKDQLWLGKANAGFIFAQSRNVQFRSGLGMRFLVDDTGSTSGLNFFYGLDLFPTSPLVISAMAELGTIGDALATQVRISGGMVFRGVEIFVAYDRLSVNDQVFGGPTVGLRSYH